MMNNAMDPKIREHMAVVCSEGKRLGVVDRVEGNRIKLTANHSPDGKHHWISASDVAHVDSQVHLSKPGQQLMEAWKSESASEVETGETETPVV